MRRLAALVILAMALLNSQAGWTKEILPVEPDDNYGNPVYYTEKFPLFYWWNHTMWNDPEQDGVNGNERVYQENIDFDRSRYKPCVFNGQNC
jgi:hypothetical protein